jgi:hypothetical protein
LAVRLKIAYSATPFGLSVRKVQLRSRLIKSDGQTPDGYTERW